MAQTGTIPCSKATLTNRASVWVPESPWSAPPISERILPKDIDMMSIPLLEALFPQLVFLLSITQLIASWVSCAFALPRS